MFSLSFQAYVQAGDLHACKHFLPRPLMSEQRQVVVVQTSTYGGACGALLIQLSACSGFDQLWAASASTLCAFCQGPGSSWVTTPFSHHVLLRDVTPVFMRECPVLH
jgi:hypothetical protein